jgi:Xaa-Pro aminopeptidase
MASLDGQTFIYRTWSERESMLAALLGGARRIALEYSPRNAIPYISRVDAGTVEFLRGIGVEPVSSADLVQRVVAPWSEAQLQSHLHASAILMEAKDRAFSFIGDRLRAGDPPTDYEVQQEMWRHMCASGMISEAPPIVATNERASSPHYMPTASSATPIHAGDTVLIDFWGKLAAQDSVYADHTWMAYAGHEVPERQAEIFGHVAAARDAAIALVRSRVAAGTPLLGYEVDRAARHVIDRAGFGDYFIHRTGHNIGDEVHGDGAHMDDYETRDERAVVLRTCFSIEPGIYLPAFGVRSEVNVYVGADRSIIVTGGPEQQAMVPLL